MGYLGREIQYGSFAKQTFTADSSTTVFTLSNGVADANNLLVSIGGIIQEPNVAYTAIGTTLTFASAPVTNDPIFVTFLGMETTVGGGGRTDVTFQKGTGNGSANPITLSTSVLNADAIRVSLNGVVQVPWTDYTANGTTLTFSTSPDATNEILVYYVGESAALNNPAAGSVTAAKMAASGVMPAWNGANLTNITLVPYSKLDDLKHNLALIGFRRSTDHGTSSLDLPNGFIDQFEDQTNVNDDNSVGETYDATNDYYTNKSASIDSNTLVLISSNTTNGSTVFTDLSSTGYTVTSTNVSHSTTKKKFGTTSMKFTGNGGSSPVSHVQIAHTDDHDLPGDFTIEFWFNTVVSDHSGNGGSLVTKHQPGVTTSQIGFRDSSNGQLMAQAHGVNQLFGPTGLHDGNWHHVAWVRSGTGSNNIKIYVDGNQEHQYTSTEPWFKASATGNLNLGSYGTSEFYGGYMDEFRMSDIARYTSNFTPTAVGFNPDFSPADNMTLVSESDTAAASTDKAYVTLFNQPVDSVTLNTDLMAWASRSSKTVTATNATNLLTANGHGLSDGDRVILTTSASDLPNGLTETAYFVVSSTTNTFQVSATSGGAAITFSDDGSGTHTVHAVTPVTLADKGDYGTGKEIIAGTADISGQPTGTDMRLIVQTKNTKHIKLHGMALQYS